MIASEARRDIARMLYFQRLGNTEQMARKRYWNVERLQVKNRGA
jgi:hypothetical protein|tara:strand:+ start:147 stop:278 length:132 start_codon:yes stop_codon:yes gene_type:complete